MKRKSLLFVLLLALMAPWAANAQETVTIGDGTSTTYYPIPGFWGWQYDVYIYTPTASEALNDNCVISSIAYDLSSISSNSGAKMEIWLKDVDANYALAAATTFSSYISGATKVYDDDEFTTTETGWKTMEFSENFTHEGGMALLVAVRGVGCTTSGGCSRNCRYTSTTSTHWYKRADSSDPGQNVSGTIDANRSNIQLTISPAGGILCEKPESIEASNVTTNAATVTWAGGSGIYNLEHKLASESWDNAEIIPNLNITSYNFTNLQPATTYDVRVQCICGTDPETGDPVTSGWKSVSFRTDCGVITNFPWTETFESYASGDFTDPCWVNEHIEGSGSSIFKIYTSTMSGNSTHMLQLPDQASGTMTKLVLPEMNLPENYEFSIDVYRSNSTYSVANNPYEGIRIYASTDGNIEGATELAFIPRQYNEENGPIPAEEEAGWYTYELPLGMSGTCYIILRGENRYCTSTYMDNFKVQQIPTCIAPKHLSVVANSVTGHEATLRWIPRAEGQTQWQFSLTQNGVEQIVGPVTSTDSTYTLTGLTGVTTYTAKVRAYCSENDQSDWSNQVSFTTGITCVAPTAFTTSDVTNRNVKLSWTSEGTDWIVAYKVSSEGDETYVEVPVTENPYILEGLAPETGYTVKVRNDCGEVDGVSTWSATRTFTTLVAYPAPNNVAADSVFAYTAYLSWNERGTAMDWEVAYRLASETEYTLSELTPDNHPFLLGEMDSLTPGADYVFKVRSLYFTEQGDTASAWSDEVAFTTLLTCPAPTNLDTVWNTLNAYGATLKWEHVYSDSWTVGYRTPDYFDGINEEFGTSIPSGWEMYTGLLSNGTATLTSTTYAWAFGTNNGVFDNHARVNIYGNYQRWLVMPAFRVPAGSELSFDLALTAYTGNEVPAPATTGTDDKFIVLISTDDMANWTTLREWNNEEGAEYVYNNIANTATGEHVSIDLSAYAGQNVRIAFYGESTVSNADNNLHIDNVAAGIPVPATQWQYVSAEEVPFELTGLQPETYYEVAVQSICGEESSEDWSASVFFTTTPSCLAPTELVVIDTTITAYTTTLSWTENGSATEWVIEYTAIVNDSTTVTDSINVTENPYTLTGLLPETPYTAKVQAYCSATDQSDWSNTVRFTTIPSCLAPTELVVIDTTITAHAATLSWTENGSATEWVIEYTAIIESPTPTTMTINVTENPYTLMELLPETPYTVRVLAACGPNDPSQWSNEVNFTTLVACPAPTELAVIDSTITAYNATLTWNGTSDNYILQMADLSAATISEEIIEVFSENFEGGSMPAGWTSEGPGTWTVGTGDYSTSTGAHDGTYNAKINHVTTGNITYLVSPVIDLSACANAKLSCWYINRSWAGDTDGFGVYYRLGNGEWNELFSTTAAHSTWATTGQLSLPSEPNVQIGFRFTDAYGYGVGLDDILIEGNPFAYEWTTFDSEATSPYTFEDLTPGTEYMVRVIGDCGEEGESVPSAAISFTTVATCVVPTDFAATDVTAHTATLVWNGENDSYVVNYRVAAGTQDWINVDFENGLPDGWTNEGASSWSVGTGDYSTTTGAHGGSYNALITHNTTGDVTYLVSPAIDLSEQSDLTLKLWYINRQWVSDIDGFGIYYRIDGGAWNEIFATTSAHSSWTEFNQALPAGAYAANCQFGFKFTDGYGYGVGLDDINISIPTPAGEWMTATAADTTVVIEGLLAETTYEAMVQAVCSEEDSSVFTDIITFTTEVACPAPINLAIANVTDSITGHTATINWIETGMATAWEICLNNDEDNLIPVNDTIFTLTGLAQDADYTVKVRANCGEEDGNSAWSNVVTFHTLVTCAAPTNLVVDPIGTEDATLTWEGESESYVVQYGEWSQVGSDNTVTGQQHTYTYDLSQYSGTGSIAIRHYNVTDIYYMVLDNIQVTNAEETVVFSEDFNGGTIPESISILDYDDDGYNWDIGYYSASAVYSASYDNDGGTLKPDNWLIISDVELGGQLSFTAYALDANWPGDKFGVYVLPENAFAEFAEEETEDNTTDIYDLVPGTPYTARVKGICEEEESNWVTSIFITEDDLIVFIANGEWDNVENWEPQQLPTTSNKVSIRANAIIPAGVVAEAKNITIAENGSITIKDGGQLKQNYTDQKVTIEKEITGYGENNDKYYLVSSPFVGRTLFSNFVSGWNSLDSLIYHEGYDLYTFDPTNGEGEEWVNYKSNSAHENFQTANGYISFAANEGYLYASPEDVTLVFNGDLNRSINNTVTKDVEYSDENKGWALVGNMYTCNAYLTVLDEEGETQEVNFYVMNENGDNFELAETTDGIAPLNGAFVYFGTTGAHIQINSEEPDLTRYNRTGKFVMNLSQDGNMVDKAVVRFGKGLNLEKMSLKSNSKLYIPQNNGKEYAVVYSSQAGNMPVSFKAETAGSYTINFATDGVNFKELVLIDNVNETKVDLLANPSYTFETEAGEFAGRFTIVYRVK